MAGEAVVEAVYERGVLRLLRPLDLPDGARVVVRIVEAGRPPRGLLEVLDEIAREYRGRAREDPLEAFLRERR
ncbi:hypothetical protein PABY_19650 [Pyrodictium abyssi]|uniref:Antitoxin n=1 Tax=Pyrodictium abyssi TaxID=54256 RepID=A0ABN6ZQB0_9CREN|nr:hypothetical protein PABY_19650 [Pyrodictium abyssi]